MKTEELKAPRKPVQTRGIRTRERILDAALALFCEKGYFKTTTNEIAQRAQVSIGSLYSYFQDKDTICLEILEGYHQKFVDAKNEALSRPELIQTDPCLWFRLLIEGLIRVHEESLELNRELTVLSFYNPEIAKLVERNKRRSMEDTTLYFVRNVPGLLINDPEGAAVITYDLISATVDRIAFEGGPIDRERLIQAAVDMLCAYLKPDSPDIKGKEAL